MSFEQSVKAPSRNLGEFIKSRFMITPENIGFSVFPIVEAIHKIQPNYIVALDCGGRVVGFATYMLYRNIYGTLPSNDHLMHFSKISRRLPKEINLRRLKLIADKSLRFNDSPKIFVIDDWINTGMTRNIINNSLAQLSDDRISVYYGVLRGFGQNVIGSRLSMTYCSRHGDKHKIGVGYSKLDGITRSVHSQKAVEYRIRISHLIKKFTERTVKSST